MANRDALKARNLNRNLKMHPNGLSLGSFSLSLSLSSSEARLRRGALQETNLFKLDLFQTSSYLQIVMLKCPDALFHIDFDSLEFEFRFRNLNSNLLKRFRAFNSRRLVRFSQDVWFQESNNLNPNLESRTDESIREVSKKL